MSQGEILGKSGKNLTQIRSMALVALGSNQSSQSGDPAETIRRGIEKIGQNVGVIRAVSRFYRTPAFPAGSGPDFVNAALAIDTDHTAKEVLSALHDTEASFGRKRHKRWAPRTLDLDLIAFADMVAPNRKTFLEWACLPVADQKVRAPDILILPHPRLRERAFVLVPLMDVAPDWLHPVFGHSIRAMVDALPPDSIREVTPL